MAQTNLNFATQKSSSTSGGTTTGTGSQGGSNAPDTGYLTIEETSNASANGGLGSFISQPAISGTFIFIGFLLLLGFIAKIYKNKQNKAFRANSGKKVFTTQILGFASLLMMFAGIGGAIARHVSSDAITGDPDAITTSGNVTASIIDTGSDYKLYCATDTVTIKESTENGYLLYAEANNGGSLVSSNASISSIQDWSTLANNTWGFYTDKETYTEITEDGKYKPIHTGSGVIAHSYEPTAAGEQVKVNYCTKVGLDTEANYTSTVTYGLIALDSENIAFVDGIDYDSTEDYDGDGLSNRKESQYGTNVGMDDTDVDGVADGKEINTYNTDPLNADTDGDGLSDYNELEFNFNPRKADTDGDGVKDSERIVSYTVSDDEHGISFDITGKGNLASSYIEVNGGVVDADDSTPLNLYSLKAAGTVTSATVSMSYDVDDLNEAVGEAIVEDELVISSYDSEADEIKTIATSIDKNKDILTATITDLDLQYAIADKEEGTDDILIEDVIGSMNDTEDESDDDILSDTHGGILKKVVKKVVKKVQSVSVAKTTDCLRDTTTGCDSGFRAASDGVAFANFSTKNHRGVCAGIAAFSVLYKGGLISDGTYTYDGPDDDVTYTISSNILNRGNKLYANTTSLSSSTLDRLGSEGFSAIVASGNPIQNQYAIAAAMDDARGAYGSLASSAITQYGSFGANYVISLLSGSSTFKLVSSSSYLQQLKENFTSKHNAVVASYQYMVGGLIRAGGHSINFEAVKYINSSTDKIGISGDNYTLKVYDNNNPGKDYDVTMRCTNISGCYIMSDPNNDVGATFFLLGTRASIAGQDDLVNIFTSSNLYHSYSWDI